jgi:hypothetical protein
MEDRPRHFLLDHPQSITVPHKALSYTTGEVLDYFDGKNSPC